MVSNESLHHKVKKSIQSVTLKFWGLTLKVTSAQVVKTSVTSYSGLHTLDELMPPRNFFFFITFIDHTVICYINKCDRLRYKHTHTHT